jgi:hypothetical protein
MSDYRDPNDPMYGNTGYEPADRRTGTSWGWIAGAVFLVIVLALAFGVGHEPSRVASNNDTAQTTPMAPPSATPSPSTVPGLAPPPLQQPAAPNRP